MHIANCTFMITDKHTFSMHSGKIAEPRRKKHEKWEKMAACGVMHEMSSQVCCPLRLLF